MQKQVLRTKSNDVLSRLAEQLGYTVALGALQPGKGLGIVISAVDGPAGFSFHLEENFEFPLHTAAPGKAMLAYLPAEERQHYYTLMEFKPFTASTICSSEDFELELKSVIEKGYGIDVSEQLEGCHCVSVPVFDAEHRPVAGLWTTGPSSQFPVRDFDQICETLRKGAQEISTRISSTGRSTNRNYILNVVAQAREVIRENLHRPLDMKELAGNLYVGYSWFRRNFKEQTGLAPAEYHQQLRIEKAAELLGRPELSIKQVSEILGFTNQNHFSALFKRKSGFSPSGFRNSLVAKSG